VLPTLKQPRRCSPRCFFVWLDDEQQQSTALAPPVFYKDGKLNLKLDGKECLLTKNGAGKFTYGAQNENEIVFVPGKSGRIDFVFTGLYSAKRVAAAKSE
jgi:hypothetical protein